MKRERVCRYKKEMGKGGSYPSSRTTKQKERESKKERKTCMYELGIDSTQRDTQRFQSTAPSTTTTVMTTRSIYAIIRDYIYKYLCVCVYVCVSLCASSIEVTQPQANSHYQRQLQE